MQGPNFLNPNAPTTSSQPQIETAIANAFPNITEEQLNAMVDLASSPEGMSILKQKLSDANDLANTEMPVGRRAGGMYIAPSPLEVIGTGLMKYAGLKQRGDLYDQAKTLSDSASADRRVLGQGLMDRSRVGPLALTPDQSQSGYMDALIRMLGGQPSNSGRTY